MTDNAARSGGRDSGQSNFRVGDHVRAIHGSAVAGRIVGFDETGKPIVRWANGAEGPHRLQGLMRTEA